MLSYLLLDPGQVGPAGVFANLDRGHDRLAVELAFRLDVDLTIDIEAAVAEELRLSDGHALGRCVLAHEVDDGLELGRPLRHEAKRRARGLGAGSSWSIGSASLRREGLSSQGRAARSVDHLALPRWGSAGHM